MNPQELSLQLETLANTNFNDNWIVPEKNFVKIVAKPNRFKQLIYSNSYKSSIDLHKSVKIINKILETEPILFKDIKNIESILKLNAHLFEITTKIKPWTAHAIQKILDIIRNHTILEAVNSNKHDITSPELRQHNLDILKKLQSQMEDPLAKEAVEFLCTLISNNQDFEDKISPETHPNLKVKYSLEVAEKIVNPNRGKEEMNEVLDFVLWNLFEHCIPVPGNKEIIISGNVYADGKGDWFAMLNMCNLIQKQFPDRQVSLIAGSSEIHRDQLHAPKVKDVSVVYKDGSDFPIDLFPASANILKKIRNAELIIMGPIFINTFKRLHDENITKKSIKFYENDIMTSSKSMGLGKTSMGIFTQPLKDYSWEDIKNQRLNTLLFGNSSPSLEEIDKYLADHNFFLCYMGGIEALNFIVDSAIFSQVNGPDKSIDILYRSKESLAKIDQEYLQRQLKKYGIKTVEIISFQEGQRVDSKINIDGGDKVMRIFDIGLLTGKEFKILTRISAPLVGCTGDNSIALALSYGKIPCYEMFTHKQKFTKNLVKLIKENFGEESALFQYVFSSAFANRYPTFKGSLEKLNEKKRDRQSPLMNSELAEQAKELGSIIRNHFSIKPALKGRVNERLLYLSDPDYAKKIDSLRQKYCDLTITLAEFEEQVSLELQKRNLFSEV
ncbi:MAG TPA: hypothetical protein VGP47_08160 [Parachlamydiaceae bacterium]|nr:hypothetical protein [Parachlamydiaceae bacterium]